MKIKIEHGIPIPDQIGLDSSETTKVVKSLQIGDSVVLPLDRRVGIYSTCRYHNIKIVTRKVDDKTYRLWRVE